MWPETSWLCCNIFSWTLKPQNCVFNFHQQYDGKLIIFNKIFSGDQPRQNGMAPWRWRQRGPLKRWTIVPFWRGRSPEKILLNSVAAKSLSNIIIIRLPLKRLKAPHFCKILLCIKHNGVPGSSVSIVSGYGLDDRAIEVRSPTEEKAFLL
jgi:hypothetical protein